MPKPVQFKVVTEDENQALVPDGTSTVSIVKREDAKDATWPYEELRFTHTHHQDGFYRALSGDPADEPGPGEWLLVVTQGKKSVVVQRLTLAEKDGVLKVSAGWGVASSKQLANTALTVSIVNYDQQSSKEAQGPAQQSMVTVRLFDRQQVVALGCTDNSSRGNTGTRFEAFAMSRANLLHAAGAVNDGVVFTLLVVTSRLKQTLVKSRSSDTKAWISVGEIEKAEIQKDKKRPVAGEEIGILDFYEHLHQTGRSSPGTVIEAGIFGHAIVEGPMVWDTYDAAPSLVARDPNDLDGRRKDWVAGGVIETSYPKVGLALHPDKGALRVWGCNHMMNVLMELAAGFDALQNKRSRTEFFMAKLNSGRENMTLDHLRANVAQLVVSPSIARTIERGDAAAVASYCGVAVQALSRSVFCAPPGMGSNYGKRGGEFVMHIEAGPGSENEKAMKYYKLEFDKSFVLDADNYVDFNVLRGAALPDPGWATERFLVLFDPAFNLEVLRLPSGTRLLRKAHGAYRDARAMTLDGESGHLYVAPGAKVTHMQLWGGDRLVILKEDAAHDTGVFVDQKGQSTLLGSPAGKDSFTKDTSEIFEYDMIYRGGGGWRFPESPSAELTGSVIESVVPRWYW